jgi:S-adenosylmethionine hydrolase
VSPQSRLPITFLSDYGYEDDFVGVCHGVIQRIAPGAVVIDIAHGLPRHDVRTAALVLRNTLSFMPHGVHLAVVDPGVGTERLPVALRSSDGRLFVGPDNGLLWLAAERFGGIERAVDLTDSPHRLEPVFATFHGRDIFAPVAARLALGSSLEEVGNHVAPTKLARLELPVPAIAEREVTAHALYIDRFGNVQLNLNGNQLSAARLEPGDTLVIECEGKRHEARYARTFADAPEGALLVYEDSYGAIALAVNRGDAAKALGLERNTALRLLGAGTT